jgi:hypothetical protein
MFLVAMIYNDMEISYEGEPPFLQESAIAENKFNHCWSSVQGTRKRRKGSFLTRKE